jgi:NAD-dependent dihydropyrimidine dehydrogenase PreA subunit
MGEYVTGVTASGGEWTPTFIVGNNIYICVSCAKCFKVCGQGVFEQVEHPDKDGMCGAMVMGIAHPEECIGCGACARSCPRKNIRCELKQRR